jgi:hypothetical protein
MSEALVAPDALHVIVRHTLPATFAKHQPVRFSLLRPETKTVDTGGHILRPGCRHFDPLIQAWRALFPNGNGRRSVAFAVNVTRTHIFNNIAISIIGGHVAVQVS